MSTVLSGCGVQWFGGIITPKLSLEKDLTN